MQLARLEDDAHVGVRVVLGRLVEDGEEVREEELVREDVDREVRAAGRRGESGQRGARGGRGGGERGTHSKPSSVSVNLLTPIPAMPRNPSRRSSDPASSLATRATALRSLKSTTRARTSPLSLPPSPELSVQVPRIPLKLSW